MTAAVEMPIVVEVDEVYQGLATGLAGKASRVPATPLSCPGCKYSVFPWPQPVPALQGVCGREVCWLLRGDTTHPPSFSPDFPPNPNLTVPPRPLRKPTSTAGSTKNPQTWFPFFLKLAKLSIPKPIFPTRVPEASSCKSEGRVEEGEYCRGVGITYLLTGTFFWPGRYQAHCPLSQGLSPPLGTEEPQLNQLLLPKGQAVSLLQKQASTVTGGAPAGKIEV